MRVRFTLAGFAALASWAVSLTFLIGAFYGSLPILMATLVLAVMLVGMEAVLLRRKLRAR